MEPRAEDLAASFVLVGLGNTGVVVEAGTQDLAEEVESPAHMDSEDRTVELGVELLERVSHLDPTTDWYRDQIWVLFQLELAQQSSLVSIAYLRRRTEVFEGSAL